MKNKLLVLIILGSALSIRVAAQNPAAPLVTQAVDETRTVRLRGTLHPMAQAQYDRGAVPESFPSGRVLLLLNRPPDREAALQEFLRSAHRPGSPSYHQWLTPIEYGQRFGPADSDVQAAENWLASQGFNVAKVTQSKRFIEFSGTAGQLHKAFQAEIHEYGVQGETHYANATELSIPASLVSLVRGVSPLNDFRAKPYVQVGGTARYSRTTKKTTPLWTAPNQFGTANPNEYPLAPEDFATQYDLAPLYQVGVNGAGQTIGIINVSNIDISMVNAFQQLFNLASNPPQVVVDGGDPGTLIGADVEAYLDVEQSGAVAPKATVNLYLATSGGLQDPLGLAAIRAVEDNQASVLSVSFGNCEQTLGEAGNQFWNDLWEQAAAQGQTVLVASGDSGPTCNEIFQNAVSGIASTPWNVAVGGTDFYYSDYASGGASATTLWNQSNDANLGSLKAPLTEQAWNDGFGLDVISDGLERGELGAGGGGPSNCIKISSTTSDCLSGYSKPGWQTGPGVLADHVRDLPDVSLYASNGANMSAYPVCAFAGECAAGPDDAADILLTGGTSASAPAMAGIMALVNQKYGRQGQANYTLYALAQQKPTAFHDVTLGNNFVPCSQGSPNCALDPNADHNGDQLYVSTVYPAGPNYDLATGLGSVDASVLVNNWNSLTFLPTTTTLQLSSTSITHGTPVTVTSSVAGTSGSGTPTGDVGILTNSPLPASQGQTFITLSGGTASSSLNYFPGGYYNVYANYEGDGVFSGSKSGPVALTVAPENSSANFSIVNGSTPVAAGGSIRYNAPLTLNIQPAGVNVPAGKQDGNATGMAVFTVDSITATVPLNGEGQASWAPPALAPGSHTASATYSGDASFNTSVASPIPFTVAKGIPLVNDSINAPQSISLPTFNLNVGSSLSITVTVGPIFGRFDTGQSAPLGTMAPTGTVTACLGPYPDVGGQCVHPNYTQTVTLAPTSGINAQTSSATATFTNLAAGSYFPTFSYSGDSNWQMEGLVDLTTISVAPAPAQAASTTTLSVTPARISGTGGAIFTTTVTGTGNSGFPPAGFVEYYDNGVFLTFDFLAPAKSGATASNTFSLNASSFWTNGVNQITAIYEGDGTYQPSTSNAATVAVTQTGGDFTITPQIPQITVQAGSSGIVRLNLTSLLNFSGVVTLTCAPSSSNINCGVNPSAPSLNGTAVAMVSINASAQAAQMPDHSDRRVGWLVGGGGFLVAGMVLGAFTDRKLRPAMLLRFGLLLVMTAGLFVAAGCSTGGNSQLQPSPPPPPPNGVTYSVVVSGAANGIIHNVKLSVVVP